MDYCKSRLSRLRLNGDINSDIYDLGEEEMKLRNKKTGEIGNLVLNINPNRESFTVVSTKNGDTLCGNAVIGDYDSLAELNEKWEDVPEEPKDYWCISGLGYVMIDEIDDDPVVDKERKEIGNYFETKEEAEKALKKLKAWKRLKDKGFKFQIWRGKPKDIWFRLDTEIDEDIAKDLDLLFGGEE